MIDWAIVCLDLRAWKPLSTIAPMVNSDWQHLNRLARSEVKEPKFSVGVKLLDLHYDHCRERHNIKRIGHGI